MTWMIPSNIRDRSWLKDIVEYNFWNVDEVEFLQWETFLKNWDRLKLDNKKLYKVEFIDWEIDTWRINLACYNPEFSTFLSLPQYALFAILKFNKKTCYYIWSTLYWKEWECKYIPTQRCNYAWMYPYSIISVWWNIQLKISEERQ